MSGDESDRSRVQPGTEPRPQAIQANPRGKRILETRPAQSRVMSAKEMNQAQIEQFVAGRMSESDARAFEDYCVANPEFARQVEFEQRLKAGITLVSRGSTEEFVRSSQPLRWQLAAAAGVVIVLFVGF